MKSILLTISFSLFGYNFSAEAGDCLDYAIGSLERAEAFRGSMMSDEDATNHLNWAYAQCESQQ